MAKKPLDVEALAHKAARRSGATATLTHTRSGRPLHCAAAEFTAVSEIEAEFDKLIQSLITNKAA
ncbi:MAG: hypothetical protein WAS73_00240 [Defluviicoccus sp.]